MPDATLSRGKVGRLQACANPRGLITALAVDHRTPLEKAITAARGAPAAREDLIAFKSAVTRVLSPYASAMLLDPEYSLTVLSQRAAHSGLLLAYEKTGYDSAIPGRLPDLLPTWSALRLVEAGAHGLKVLLHYNPFDDAAINDVKAAFVERIGAECCGLELPFYLEPVTYDEQLTDRLEFARRKPDYVRRVIQEFTEPRYGVDVLKVQTPVDPQYVAGCRANAGQPALFTRAEALAKFRAAADASTLPLIFLSGGADDETFLEALELAGAAGARFAGIACGRATWQDGVAIYAQQGMDALEDWLAGEGVRRMKALDAVVATNANPWWLAFGGRVDATISAAGAEG